MGCNSFPHAVLDALNCLAKPHFLHLPLRRLKKNCLTLLIPRFSDWFQKDKRNEFRDFKKPFGTRKCFITYREHPSVSKEPLATNRNRKQASSKTPFRAPWFWKWRKGEATGIYNFRTLEGDKQQAKNLRAGKCLQWSQWEILRT